MTTAVFVIACTLAFFCGWYGATVVWERAIRRKDMDPNYFRRRLRRWP